MRKILLILGVLILTLGLCVGICNASLHTVVDDEETYIAWVDELGNVIFKIDDDAGVSWTGTLTVSGSVLWPTTSQAQFYDTGLYLGATGNGALALDSDGTLAIGATTSSTLTTPISAVAASTSHTVTSPAVKFIATTSVVHEYDSASYVTQTVNNVGAVVVSVTGDSAGSYEIATDDAGIILDSATTILLEAGLGTISVSATGIDMNSLVITEMGKITATDAAGPAFINEAASNINPSLVANRADETTGIGWSAGKVHIVVSGADEYSFSTSTIDMNSNTITEAGNILANAATGPAVLNEASIATNPTLCPDRNQQSTGIGSAASVLHLIIGGISEVSVSATAVTLPSSELIITAGNFTVTGDIKQAYDAADYVTTTVANTGVVKVTVVGDNAASYEIETEDGAITLDAAATITLDAGTGDIDTTDALVISPVTLGTYIDFELENEWVSGTLIRADFAGATTLTSSAVGVCLDFSGVHVDSGQAITAIDLTFPDLTFNAITKAIKGVDISGDTLTQTASGTGTWIGVNITIPTTVETAGTINAYGIKITGGTCTTDPNTYGIHLSGTFETAGIALSGTYTASGITIGSCTTSNIAISGTNATGISLTGTYSVHGIAVGVSGTPIDLVAYDDRLMSIWGSSDAIGGTVMPLYVSMATDGACKARAAEFVLTPTAKLGQWANAVKAYLDLTGAPGTSGTAAAICAEILWPDETQQGTLAVLELEAVANTGLDVHSGTAAFILANLTGTDADEWEEQGYFFSLQGFTSTTTQMLFRNTIKCLVGSTDWYLALSSAEDSYTTAYPIVSSLASGAAIDITGPATGIDIGANTTAGINMTGGGVLGIDFNGAWTGNVIQIGDSSAPLTTATESLAGVYVNMTYSKTAGTGGSLVAGVFRSYYIGTTTNYGSVTGVQGRAGIATAKQLGGSAGSWNSGVSGVYDVIGTIDNANAFACGVKATLMGAGTFTAARHVAALWVDNQAQKDMTSGMESSLVYLTNNGLTASQLDAVWYIRAPDIDYFWIFGAGTAGPWWSSGGTDCTTSGATDPAGTIKIKDANGDVGYIRIWAAQ